MLQMFGHLKAQASLDLYVGKKGKGELVLHKGEVNVKVRFTY